MGAPVILCGKTEQIGVGVIAMLKPEYDGEVFPLLFFFNAPPKEYLR